MIYKVALGDTKQVFVIGCGGTGGFLAESLSRLLSKEITITLIDHDRIEPRNLIRQNFYPDEVGLFKSEALAKRLARLYGRTIRYSVYPYAPGYIYTRGGLIISCVDGAKGREAITDSARGWWIDTGNGYGHYDLRVRPEVVRR